MTETPARKPRPRRTFSTFGDVRKMPSEYEIVTGFGCQVGDDGTIYVDIGR